MSRIYRERSKALKPGWSRIRLHYPKPPSRRKEYAAFVEPQDLLDRVRSGRNVDGSASSAVTPATYPTYITHDPLTPREQEPAILRPTDRAQGDFRYPGRVRFE